MKKQLNFLGVSDKSKDVYSKFNFEEVWKFINPNEELVFEIRMKSADKTDKTYHPRILGEILKCNYHWTGVFLRTLSEFKNSCIYGIQNQLTMYLSSNPKRKSIHSRDKNQIPRFNGEKQSELGYYYILVDFDPTKLAKKDEHVDTSEEAYKVAKQFLSKSKNIKKYMLLSSGNGCQLKIPLDTPIMLPKPEYDEHKRFIETEDTEIFHRIVKVAMKETVLKYSNQYVDVDLTSFEVARVGRLPFSINWKSYEKLGIKKYAGVIEIVDEGENTGLYDHIMSHWDSLKEYNEKVKEYGDRKIADEFKVDENSIQDAKLTKLLLKKELPPGGRNNVLFFQWKLLCMNCGIDLRHPKIREMVRNMERIQNESYPLNEPRTGNFNPVAIINWCIDKNIKPIYPALYGRSNVHTLTRATLENIKKDLTTSQFEISSLPADNTILRRLSSYLRKNPIRFSHDSLLYRDIQKFMLKIINDYGEEKLEYLMYHNVLLEVINKT